MRICLKRKMENNNWKLIRLANEKYLKIPPQVSDYLAVQDILRLCSYGLSNKTIANRLDMDVDYITDTLMHYIEFSGWVQDMDFNPYYIYQRSNKSFGKYNKDLEAFLPIEHVWET